MLKTTNIFRATVAGLAMLGLLSLGAPFAFAQNPPLTVSFTTTATSPTGKTPIPVTATFSEGVTNFTASDLNIGNGTVTNIASTSDAVYTFGIIPAAQGSVSVDLNGGIVSGIDGQTNQPAPQLQIIFDPNASDAATTTASSTVPTNTGTASSTASSSAPTLTITSGPADGETTASTSVTFTFTTDGTAVLCDFGSTFACSSPLTLGSDAAPLGDSTYTLTITAGNGTASTSVTTHFTVLAATSTASSTSTGGSSSSSSSSAPAPAPSGGGGGGGGVIGGPLSVGFVNTNPYQSPFAATAPSPTAIAPASAPSVVATAVPTRTTTSNSSSGKVLGAATQRSGPSSLAVNTLTSSNSGFSSSSSSTATGTSTATSTSSTSVSVSTTTPGVPNTGASTQGGGVPAWVWIAILLLVIILGGAWLLTYES